ncbi:MAG: hypothetical protein FJ387_16120 [Verrucomicrobia bacterium]|nr:hypothetical protein [Verrucomicrobiota bacterium]
MRLRSLTQLVDAARALARPERIVVIGSSALLPAHPELGEPGQPLDASYDSDLLVSPMDEELAAVLGEAVGQQSLFAKRHGYYADILRPTIAETLPAGWESRLHPVPGYDNVFALDMYDLALVKLLVGRPKDLDLLRSLLKLGLLESQRLRQHYQQTPLGDHEATTAGRNLTLVLREPGTA